MTDSTSLGLQAPRTRWRRFALAAGFCLTSGVASANWVLDPRGPAAAAIAELSWVMFIIASVVVVVVLGLYLYAITGGGSRPAGARHGSTAFVVVGGIVFPGVILISVLTYSLGKTAVLQSGAEDALVIEVTGHQWWWEVRYPEQGIVTANEIHIPVGRRVRVELGSVDVIHAFWVPELNGKMDLVPGQVNTLMIEAEDSGIFRGSCAEYCGTQHAKMNLLVSAEPNEAFENWIAGQQQPAALPDTAPEQEGLEVFLSSACVYCHTVEGTNASGDLGPDLTHLAARLSLGAGTIANNRGNLAGWIVNSQAIKPGNRMPPMYLEPDDLQALLAYLGSLE